MKSTNKTFKELEAAAGQFISALEQTKKDDSRYQDVFEYKCKLQQTLADWYNLLKKWDEDERSPLVN